MHTTVVTEIVQFKLVAGVADGDFVERVNRLEVNFHSRLPGFLDTELAKSKEGWVMFQHWRTLDEAKAAVQRMMKEPSTMEFRQALDPTSVKMQLLEQVRTWREGELVESRLSLGEDAPIINKQS